MDLNELVQAILGGDLIAARDWVSDAYRANVDWEHVEKPRNMNEIEISIAAGLIELLASRKKSSAPAWAHDIGPISEQMVLDPGLQSMRRSFERAKSDGPESLRKRNLVALPDFLDVA